MLAAGFIRPEWIDGLGTHSRFIAITSGGGFTITGEGKGRHFTHAHRERGAITVKRLADGMMLVSKWRTAGEEKAMDAAREAKWKEEREQQAWKLAKVARGERDFLAEWKASIAGELDSIGRLAEGKLVYTGFPEITLGADALARVKKSIEQLRRAIAEATPRANDLEIKSNVITLRSRAYRHMSASD